MDNPSNELSHKRKAIPLRYVIIAVVILGAFVGYAIFYQSTLIEEPFISNIDNDDNHTGNFWMVPSNFGNHTYVNLNLLPSGVCLP